MNLNPSKQIQGFFISFTDEETLYIHETLEQHGYAIDQDGLKKWILDSMQAAVEDPKTYTQMAIDRLQDYIMSHPEKVSNYVGICTGILEKLKKKKA